MVDAQLNINMFDGIVFGVLFLSALVSFFRGFIREFISLLAWIGAALITLYLVEDVAKFLKPYAKEGYGGCDVCDAGNIFFSR